MKGILCHEHKAYWSKVSRKKKAPLKANDPKSKLFRASSMEKLNG